MKKSFHNCTLLIVSLLLSASTSGSKVIANRPAIGVSPHVFVTPTPPLTVSLTEFNPIGDGVGNDGPAFQRALDALAQAGGGTLHVPQGRYAISTPVFKDFTGLASSITIRGVESLTPIAPPTSPGSELAKGLDLVSEIYPRTGEAQNAISIKGLQDFLIQDIAFIGTQGVITDAAVTLLLTDIERASVRHNEFYGLATFVAGGGIVKAVRSHLEISKCKFLGSTAASGRYVPVVENVEWKGIEISDTHFVDYGLRPDFFSKTGLGASISWINIGNAASPEPQSPRREVIIRDVFLDEGSYWALSSLPFRYLPASAPIDLIYISGLCMNVPNFEQTGHLLFDAERVLIEKSRYAWSHNAAAAISFFNVGNVILDLLTCVDHADTIYADSNTQRLTVINSIYSELASFAQTTEVIITESELDPVQYVRARFQSLLGREPDPAAHFYWSDLLIRCGSEVGCQQEVREYLNDYLELSPAANFSITGRVTDENGVPLLGATVTLSGSQLAATTTNEIGEYNFSNLPTSGVYTVAVSKGQYLFPEPAHTFAVPSGNQTQFFLGFLIPELITRQGTDLALALESVTFLADSFFLNNPISFAQDSRTRVILFTKDLNLTSDEVAEAARAQGEDAQGRIYPMEIEFIGQVPGFSFFNQIVVRLPDDFSGNGELLISITRKGVPSNKARIQVNSSPL